MNRFKWETIDGKAVLFQDFSNLKKEEIINELNSSHTELENKGMTGVVIITNIENITFDRNTTKAFEEISLKNKRYVKASAIYGVGTWQRVAIEAVGKLTNREFNVLKSEDEVTDWIKTLD